MNPDEEAIECRACFYELVPEDRPPCSDCVSGSHFKDSRSNADLLSQYPTGMVAVAGMFVGIIIGGIGGLLIGLAL